MIVVAAVVVQPRPLDVYFPRWDRFIEVLYRAEAVISHSPFSQETSVILHLSRDYLEGCAATLAGRRNGSQTS